MSRLPHPQHTNKTNSWPEPAIELYRLSDRRLSAELVSTFADRGFHVVGVTDPYGRNLGSLDRSRYFFFQVAPQLYSRGWVDPVPDPLLLRKSGSAVNRTRTTRSIIKKLWTIDHRGGHIRMFAYVSLRTGSFHFRCFAAVFCYWSSETSNMFSQTRRLPFPSSRGLRQ
jgi:hypothetical protein